MKYEWIEFEDKKIDELQNFTQDTMGVLVKYNNKAILTGIAKTNLLRLEFSRSK